LTYNLIDGLGNLFVCIKYFKFINKKETNNSQCQIEIIKTFSFIDIQSLSNLENDSIIIKQEKEEFNDNLIKFKDFIESLNNKNFLKINEMNNVFIDLLKEIFSLNNLYTIFLGFIEVNSFNEYNNKLILDTLIECKKLNNKLLYDYMQSMNISLSKIGNENNKEDFQILECILSELIFYIENKYKKLDIYKDIKDMTQQQKFYFLKDILYNKFNLKDNKKINYIFEEVFKYFKSRTNFKNLINAKNESFKLNENLHSFSIKKIFNSKQISNKNSVSSSDGVIKNFLEKMNDNKNIKSNNKNNSIIFNNLSNFSFLSNEVENNINTNKKKISFESTFVKNIFTEYQNNLSNTFKGIYKRFIKHKKGCFSCEVIEEMKKPQKFQVNSLIDQYMELKKLETRIDIDKISELDKSKKSESIVIHFDTYKKLTSNDKIKLNEKNSIVKINNNNNTNIKSFKNINSE